MVPLKYWSNFWESLDMALISCENNTILIWYVNCVISDAPVIQAATFAITDTKLYIPVVTLSAEGNGKLIQQLKSGLKRIIHWNKYKSQTTTQDGYTLQINI